MKRSTVYWLCQIGGWGLVCSVYATFGILFIEHLPQHYYLALLLVPVNRWEAQCSKTWDAFTRNCTDQPMRGSPVLRQLPPSACLPPVA